MVSLAGTWMESTALQWLVYRLTGSVAMLGLLGFANQVPLLLLAWMGGYMGDRYDRHRGVIVTQSCAMVIAFLLAGLTLTHTVREWHLIVLAFLAGVVNAFDVPIRQAFLVQMVGREDLPNAIALNSSIFNGARAVGPAIAGFAIVSIHEGGCFLVNGLSFVAVLVALLMMRIGGTAAPRQTEPPVRSFVNGFKFAMRDLPIRSALFMLCLLSFFGLQYAVFLPIYAHDVLHGGAKALGLLMSAAGVGAVLGALQFAARTRYTGLSQWIAATCTVSALGLILLSHATSFWACELLLFIIGFSATSQMAATNTIIQQRVPDELRSRLMAVYATMFMGVQPLGALAAGGLGHHLGTPNTVLLFGLAVLAGSAIFIWLVAARVGKTPVEAAAGALD